MEKVMEMAGDFTAHAILSVSSGKTFVPIIGYLKSDGSHYMQRLVMGATQATELGEKRISNLDPNTLGASFIKDVSATFETGKTDALMVDIRFSYNTENKLQITIPYRHAKHEEGFAVHRLKITQLEGISKDRINSLTDAFFNGINSNTEGSRIWNDKYVDQAGTSRGYAWEENTEFSSDDFETLKRSVFLVFFLVAAADGKVNKKELTAFIKILSDPNKMTNSLLKRIISNVITDAQSIALNLASQQLNHIEELGRTKEVIDSHLPHDDAMAFKKSLLLIGMEIVEASGGFFGFGKKISKEEKDALAGIALCLGINP